MHKASYLGQIPIFGIHAPVVCRCWILYLPNHASLIAIHEGTFGGEHYKEFMWKTAQMECWEPMDQTEFKDYLINA